MSKPYKDNYQPIVYALLIVVGVYIGTKLSNFSNLAENTSYQKLYSFISAVENDYVDDVNMDSIVDLSIQGIVSHLDPHSSYFIADRVGGIEEEMNGAFEGIGVEYQMYKDTLVVIKPIEGGPSFEEGVQKGDRLLKVDTLAISGQDLTNSDIVKRIRGPKGSIAKLTLLRNLKDTIYIDVKRDEIPIKSVDIAYEIEEYIGYIKVSKFSKTTTKEFNEAINKLYLKGVKDIIIDLRNNPGGILEGAIRMSEHFLKKGDLIVYTKGKNKEPDYFYAEKTGGFSEDKICLLINENSASASEIVAGALQDNDRATIIGRRSFGKGLVQQHYNYTDGSAARITTSRYYTPSGRSIQRSYAKGNDEYYNDFYNRTTNGELINEDSIPVVDSLIFYTTGGRKVYGGGGIHPDVFMPDSNLNFSNGFRMLLLHGILRNQSFLYIDKNRKELDKLGLKEFIENFEVPKSLIDDVLNEGKDSEVILSNFSLSSEENDYLNKRLKLEIANKQWSNNGFYRVKNLDDKEVLKAIEILKDGTN
jgi:carboxyl-terminal processing protease